LENLFLKKYDYSIFYTVKGRNYSFNRLFKRTFSLTKKLFFGHSLSIGSAIRIGRGDLKRAACTASSNAKAPRTRRSKGEFVGSPDVKEMSHECG